MDSEGRTNLILLETNDYGIAYYNSRKRAARGKLHDLIDHGFLLILG
jgi:hypothetical protein